LQRMQSPPGRAPTGTTPLLGGGIADFADLQLRARREVPEHIPSPTLEAWLRNHGSEYRSLAQLAGSPDEARLLGNSTTAVAEVTHAVRDEMAVHLEDVVLRRTDLGGGSHPGPLAISQAAQRMQQLLGWTQQRLDEEISLTEAVLKQHLAAVPETLPAL